MSSGEGVRREQRVVEGEVSNMRSIGPLGHVGTAIKASIIAMGIVAGLNFAMLGSHRPLVRLARVDGYSMDPTLINGEDLLFARKSWHVGSIVLADVGEPDPVVKRVVAVYGDRVGLNGDNRLVSESYTVRPEDILGVMMIRSRLVMPTLRTDPEA